MNISEYTLCPGIVLVIPSEAIMEIVTASADMLMVSISGSDQYIDNTLYNALMAYDSIYIKMPEDEFEECLALCRLMKQRLSTHHAQESKPIIQRYMMTLCSIIKQRMCKAEQDRQTESDSPGLYHRFLISVKRHYHERRALSFYADDLAVSMKHLSMVVKKESGKNASDIIRDLIVFEAKAMLISGEYTIEQISDNFNFPNQSFFSKFFRQQTGLTPSGYKKSSR